MSHRDASQPLFSCPSDTKKSSNFSSFIFLSFSFESFEKLPPSNRLFNIALSIYACICCFKTFYFVFFLPKILKVSPEKDKTCYTQSSSIELETQNILIIRHGMLRDFLIENSEFKNDSFHYCNC